MKVTTAIPRCDQRRALIRYGPHSVPKLGSVWSTAHGIVSWGSYGGYVQGMSQRVIARMCGSRVIRCSRQQANVHPKVVSERLGHSSVVITRDTYSHILPGLQEEAAEKFSEIMGDAR